MIIRFDFPETASSALHIVHAAENVGYYGITASGSHFCPYPGSAPEIHRTFRRANRFPFGYRKYQYELRFQLLYNPGQTSPDLEKIVLLSDDFDVTTDYLLKGTQAAVVQTVYPEWENSASENGRPGILKSDAGKMDARIFTMAGSALNLIGLIAAAMIRYERQTAAATAAELILHARRNFPIASSSSEGRQ